MADGDRIVAEVAAAVGLAEGEAGVRAVLSPLARLEPVSIRRISRAAELPVPIVAAICGELRKRGIVANERPARLTSSGRELFGAGTLRIDERGLRAVAAEIARVTANPPPPRLELDQCHCTFETKLRRVLALHEADALVGRRILLLGDDDLTSIALDRLVRRLGSSDAIARLAVVDVDPDVLAFVARELRDAPFPVSFNATTCGIEGISVAPPAGCLIVFNDTFQTFTSLDLTFGGLGDLTFDCPTSDPLSIFANSTCTSSGGIDDLFFSGGDGLPGGQIMFIVEDGVDPGLFVGTGVVGTTPEPESLALLSTGMIMMTVGFFANKRRQVFGKK